MAGISIGDAILHIGADTSKLEKSLKGIGDKMSKMGKNLTLKVTAPLAAFGALSIKTAADFSKAMAKVNAVTGATIEEFEELNTVAKELGRTTMFTATQVAEAMSFMGMAGLKTEEILAAIPDTLNLAAAGALDMGTAANIVTNILAGFGMETSQLGGAVDVLAKAFTSSNTDLLMLGESMKFAGPVAKGFGLTFEETAAIMGIFGNAGIQASLAGTSLRGALVQLNNKADQFGITMFDAAGKIIPMADILEQLEAKGLTAGEMMDLFGLRAGPAMTALLEEGSDSLRAFTKELENAGGTAQRIAETQMEGLHGSLIRLKSAFEGLQLSIAEEITPGVEALTAKLTDLFRGFADLPAPVRLAAVALGIFAAALGPLLWMTGSLITNLAVLKTSFIGVKLTAIATTAVLKVMIGASVGLGAALTILTGIVLGLALGLGMVIFGITQLISNSKRRIEQAKHEAEVEKMLAETRKEAAEMEADREIRQTRLTEEHAKAVEGLDNEYAELLQDAKDAGFVIGEAGEAYLLASSAADAYAGAIERQNEAMKAQLAIISPSKEARLIELAKFYGIKAIDWSRPGITVSTEQEAAARARVSLTPNIQGYQGGGPILEPTLLYGMSSRRVYAQAEAGERVTPGGGGFRTATILVQLDGRIIAQVIGEPLVEQIRLRTGAQY